MMPISGERADRVGCSGRSGRWVWVWLGLLLLAGCADAPQSEAPQSEARASEASGDVPWLKAAAARGDDGVMLQGFHWASHREDWWRVVEAAAPRIAAAGFDRVWLPPSSQSAAAAPQGYLPNELYAQSGAYGDAGALRAAIGALHRVGVMAIADIVINHRVGTYDWADFRAPVWDARAVCSDDEWAGARGGRDSGATYHAARDIDHSQAWVRSSLVEWMAWLRDEVGYDGWRFDYVKGYGAQYVGEYVRATGAAFAVGEWWTDLDLGNPDAHRQQLMAWIDGTGGVSSVFDFTTKGLLQQAVAFGEYHRLRDGSGRPAGAIGWWPGRAVTFIDNHDTGPSPRDGQDHWPFPSGEVMQGYAYILTHPGVPTVYWVHFFDWGLGGAIEELMRLRQAHGIHAESGVRIVVADRSRYAAVIDERLAVKIGPGEWAPGAGWRLVASGRNFAVWSNLPVAGPGPAPGGSVRTVIYIRKETRPGQDIYIRGGHDQALVAAGHYRGESEPLRYLNTRNATTAAVKAGDAALDWAGDSALDWTTNSWPAAWGAAARYGEVGYGLDAENRFGAHYWKLDVEMVGAVGEWFEFKAFLKEGGQASWEPDIAQPGTPHRSRNHWGRKGYVTVVSFGEGGVQHIPL